jgi:ferrochelatase
MTVGILLINLGTPDDPSTSAVRRYLREFLMDGRVLDINFFARAALVNLVIAPFRAPKSAHAYQQIWSEDGSPLLAHSQALARAMQAALGQGFQVALGMRYGRPSLESALGELADCERVIALPLYPQYASASTGTALERLYQLAAEGLVVPSIAVVPPFYEHPAFIDAVAAVARPQITDDDFVLFSYHGLPERQLPCTPCEGATVCPAPVGDRTHCYRAQCYATTRALVERLGLEGRHTVSFQSRLGSTPWIRPYTDEIIEDLVGEQGHRRIVVLSPSFVSDCLETLEEIGIRLRAQFTEAGGEHFELVPCVNAAPEWVAGAVRLICEAGGIEVGQINGVVTSM